MQQMMPVADVSSLFLVLARCVHWFN